jgi:hypothetical protein
MQLLVTILEGAQVGLRFANAELPLQLYNSILILQDNV